MSGSSLTRTPPSMIRHESSVKKGDVLLSDGIEFGAGSAESEDTLAIALDESRCHFDSQSGTLVLIQTNKAIIKISGFSELASIADHIGRRGPRGLEGKRGGNGRAGRDGKDGDQGCSGAKGDTGPQGNTGATGATGNTGATGGTGGTGATGDRGATGADAAAGTIIAADGSLVEYVRDTQRKLQGGAFQDTNDVDTITVTFPIPFDIQCTSFILTFIDAKSVQAIEYEIVEIDKGGVTIHVPRTPPLSDDWDFTWLAFGR